MGIFGSLGRALTTPGATSGLSPLDRLGIFAAAAGGDVPTALALRQLPLQRQQLQRKQDFTDMLLRRMQGTPDQVSQAQIGAQDGTDITDAFAPQFDVTPGRPGLDINSPDLPQLAMGAEDAGVKIGNLLEVLKAQQPDVKIGPDGRPYNGKSMQGIPQRFGNPQAVNNTVVDLNNPDNEGRVIPVAPVNGAMPIYDNRGRVIDWYMPKGAAGAIKSSEQAKALGGTMGTVFNRPNGDGTTTPKLGVNMFGQGVSGAGDPAPGGVGAAGVTQSPQDAEYAKSVAAGAAKAYQGLQDAGSTAQTRITGLKRMASLLDGLDTGRLTPAALAANSIGSSLGIKIDPKWGNIEAANAIANKLVLDNMGGSLGAGFSNADRDFAGSIGPQTTQTPQGRKQVIAFAIAKAQREQDIATKARQWQQRFGRIDRPDATGKTFQDYLQAWAEANPLMGRQ